MRGEIPLISSRRGTLSQSGLTTPNSLKTLIQRVFCISHYGCTLLGMLVIKLIALFKLAGNKLAWFTERQVQLRCEEKGVIESCEMVPYALSSGFGGE